MKNKILTIPNISEAKNRKKIFLCSEYFRKNKDVQLIDVDSDIFYNRTVFTLLLDKEKALNILFHFYKIVRNEINIYNHAGEHPFLGAIDVMPFVVSKNLESVNILIKKLGKQIDEKFKIPVFLYEKSAQIQQNSSLAQIRRGGIHNLKKRLYRGEITPDYSCKTLHPSFGATVIGARGVLVAFNLILDTKRVKIAKRIANIVRETGGGLKQVRAIGVKTESFVEVSCNLLNYKITSIYELFDKVKRIAQDYGTRIIFTKIIGIPPKDIFTGGNISSLLLRNKNQKVLEDFNYSSL